MEPKVEEGIALLCDREGRVVQILRDDLDISKRVPPGSSAVQLVEPANFEKALQFIRSVQEGQSIFDWEINAPVAGQLTLLNFVGVPLEQGMMIVATRSRRTSEPVNEGIMWINNELMNSLRMTMKDLSSRMREPPPLDSALYDELSRVNNELTNLQRELTKKNVELERLNGEKNQLLGMVAHDMRNPLGVIFNYCEYLETEMAENLDEEQRSFFRTIKNSSAYLLGLLNDLLDVSAIESGNLNLRLKSVDLCELLERHIALNRFLAEKKKIQIRNLTTDSIPVLRIDGRKIEQVIDNLLSNAIKFSHAETQVTVKAERKENEIVIAFHDEGQGVPEGELSRLFKIFSRTSTQSTAGEHSTGLGLSIARNIVEGHGGHIWVESEVAKGSTFYFSLPIQREPSLVHGN